MRWIAALLLTGALAHAGSVPPTDPDIRYTGRWDQSQPATPWAQAQGSSIVVSFEGTSLAVSMTTTSQEWFRVVVDGDGASSFRTQIPTGSPVTLVSGLADQVHVLELVKETDVSRATLVGIELDPGRSLVSPPPAPTRRIVFYGDSNLAGYSLMSERNLPGSNLVGTYNGYAGVTARMFGAEYHNVSRSGATIQSLHSRYDRIDWNTATPLWDFSSTPADVVVVGIGANDWWRPENTNRANYHALLDDLRADHPSAHIMLYNSYGWQPGEPSAYTHEVIAERNDPNMSSAVFPWVFEQFHGCETDYGGMAMILSQHLAGVMGWVPQPQDVVSGYGENGNVANGSFEERAPFGGWGWRYFDDPGVSRIHDPAGSFHGDYHLRLENGASSHQTNPASDGATIDLRLRLRGEAAGAQADVTIGFRDQDAGADIAPPMYSETQTFDLTTSWQQYTMSVTAPGGLPNPVCSARVTVEARSGSTIHVDRVQTGPVPPAAVPVIGPGALVVLAFLLGLGGITRLSRSR